MRRDSPNKIHSIEALRGLAAFLVMGFHYSSGNPVPFLDPFFQRGYLGVDIFFVISGFVIYLSTEREEERGPAGFFVRRLFRIVPLAWLCTVIQLAATGTTAPSAWLHDLLFLPLTTATPPYFGFHAIPVLWTLSYEFWFYLVFGLVLAIPALRRRRGIAAAVLLVAILGAAQAFLGHFTLSPSLAQLPPRPGAYPAIACLIANPVILYFPIGILFGWIHVRHRGLVESAAVRWGGSAACLLGAALVFALRPEEPQGAHSGQGGAAILLSALALFAGGSWPPRAATAAAILGSLSYATYLIHPMTPHLLGLPGASAFYAGLPPLARIALLSAVTLVLAAGAHRLVERPFQALGRRVARRLNT